MIRTFIELLANPAGLMESCEGITQQQLCDWGMDTNVAKDIIRLREMYYSDHPSAAPALHALVENKHTLGTLQRIERYVRRTRKHRWRLRRLLCSTPLEQLDKVAQEFLDAHRPPPPKEDTVRMIRRRNGRTSLVLTSDEETISDVETVIRHQCRTSDNSPSVSLKNIFNNSSAVARPEITVHLVITIDEMDRVLQGEGEEMLFKLSNGATLTGAQLAQRELSKYGYMSIVHPSQGPVNLYRLSRFASEKQRVMLEAVSMECAWPECHVPIDRCQIHHMVPWKNGGETNIDNLVPLCAYHNGLNDDDQDQPRHGRIERHGGEIVWRSPWL